MPEKNQDKSQSLISQKLDELKELNSVFESDITYLNERAEFVLSKDAAQNNSKDDEEQVGDCKLSEELIGICNVYRKNLKMFESIIRQICL